MLERVEEFVGKLAVDVSKLPEELLSQPEIFARMSALCADQLYKTMEAKRLLEQKKADTAMAMKERPSEFGLTKTSDASVNEAVTAYSEVVMAAEVYNKEYALQKELEGYLEACRQRAKMLELEVKLVSMGYFMEPSELPPSFDSAHSEKIKASVKRRKKEEVSS